MGWEEDSIGNNSNVRTRRSHQVRGSAAVSPAVLQHTSAMLRLTTDYCCCCCCDINTTLPSPHTVCRQPLSTWCSSVAAVLLQTQQVSSSSSGAQLTTVRSRSVKVTVSTCSMMSNRPFDAHCCHDGYSYKASCARPGHL